LSGRAPASRRDLDFVWDFAALRGAPLKWEHRARAQKRLPCRSFLEWRDPDSNRGHHDFQAPEANR
jgi:hypothetical protein